MFCPRCGKDCKDANFCPSCGQNLQTIHMGMQGGESVGDADRVRCPNCGSTSVAVHRDNRMKNEHLLYRNGFIRLLGFYVQEAREKKARAYGMECECLQCAHRWHPKLQTLHRRHRKHIRKVLRDYQSVQLVGIGGTYISLDENHVWIHRSNEDAYGIPYHLLVAVEHREGVGPAYGRFTVRDEKHKRRPMPKALKAAQIDDLTILYPPESPEGFREAFVALAAVIEENKKAGVI